MTAQSLARHPLQRGSLRWYLNRAAVMTPAELPHRAFNAGAELVGRAMRRFGIETAVPPPRTMAESPTAWLAIPEAPAAELVEACLREADEIAAGFVPRIDGRTFDLGSPPDWARSGLPDDDVRHAMELHRHTHLVRLAQAWQLGRRPLHRQALIEQLETWLDLYASGHGVGWQSALDVGLRLVNWSIVWQLLDGHRESALPPALRERWLRSIYTHAKFARHNRSRYSSANNHLLGELLGLVAAGCCWPFWRAVVAWGRSAERELSAEALLQTHADGVSREQASAYQVFVFELLAAFVLMQRSRGLVVQPRLLRRMKAMAVFGAALRDRCGLISHHGDADHARALPLALRHEDPVAGLISLAVALDIAPELAPLMARGSSACAWLPRPEHLSFDNQPRVEALVTAARARLPRAFAEGGYYLLGRDFGRQSEVIATFDAGPVGYLGIAAHGHADALSLRLSVAGRPVLVDRGTYSYNTHPQLRHYLRSTQAHNTVCIDGQDQSVYGGPFLWLRKASTGLTVFASTDDLGQVVARHDGYRSLPDPVTHERRVDWDGSSGSFVVLDTITALAEHEVEVLWHFDPGCEVGVPDDFVIVRTGNVQLRLSMVGGTSAGTWQLHLGDPQSLHGWHAPHFGTLIAAPTLIWRTRTRGPASLRTRIDVEIHP